MFVSEVKDKGAGKPIDKTALGSQSIDFDFFGDRLTSQT